MAHQKNGVCPIFQYSLSFFRFIHDRVIAHRYLLKIHQALCVHFNGVVKADAVVTGNVHQLPESGPTLLLRHGVSLLCQHPPSGVISNRSPRVG